MQETKALWKIALIDDDFQVLRGMRHAIPWDELQACPAGEAISGEEGLRLVAETQPDIIITDLYMPGMNGIEMIEKLRSSGYQGSIIILSGYSDFDHARKALQLNVDDYITKPITLEQLREVLHRVIAKLEEAALRKLEHYELKKSVQVYKSMLMRDWLHAVISGTTPENEAEFEDALELREKWKQQLHVVLVVEVIHNERIRGIPLTDWNLFKFGVGNIIQELLDRHWPDSHLIQLYGFHFAVLLHAGRNENPGQVRENGLLLGREITECIARYLQLRARIGIGGVKEGWKDIHNSTEEAFQSLLVGQFSDGPSVDHADGGIQLPSSFAFYQNLSRAMLNRDESEIAGVIEEYFDQLEKSVSIQSPSFYRVMAAEIWALFQYSLHESGNVPLPEIEEDISMTEYNEISGREHLLAWIRPKIKRYCEDKTPSVNRKHKKTVDYMIQYIHSHYHEDITLEDLASRLYISKNYLNQLFKKVTGDTFMNYVIRVRMQKAKELLLEGNHYVYEIAEMVGYSNVPYFSTLFKKYFGVTPSELMR